MTRVTIGIPVYNEEANLAETVESALGQEVDGLEVVVSDNKSTDGSAGVIARCAAADPRVRPVYREKNGGLDANFFTLLENTRSPYFAMLGAHDLFLPGYVDEAVAFLETHREHVMAYPRSKLLDGRKGEQGYYDCDIDTAGLDLPGRMLKVASNLTWCTCIHGVFRTDVMRKLPVRRIRGADQLLLFAAARHGHIKFLDRLGIMRRERWNETPEMTERRRISAGFYREPDSMFFNSWSVMVLEHLKYVFADTGLPLTRRLALASAVVRVFRRRLGVSFFSIVFAGLLSGSPGRGEEVPGTPPEGGT